MDPSRSYATHFRPFDLYDTANLTDEAYKEKNLAFDRRRETASEQIIRVYQEQRQQPKFVLNVAGTIQNWGTTHILTKGEVLIYRDPHTEDLREGEQPHDDRVLLRSTFADRNHNVEIEFQNGNIIETSTFYLLWCEFLSDADFPYGSNTPDCTAKWYKSLGEHLVATCIPDSHQFGYIVATTIARD
eukprot:CAMPEP_0171319464 /NCGR_PEP_ID=MMETSP0816-20121228/96800_1 /TAXON_ID=420281 /ORGANISM="Proboscia inermis, Strain CCAP1064/1" /LENGTH=186 /DNA_ID=CAMNT_0011815177 /DNA_START=54 /DNA_END=614 /DNA_ORIENTATION=-